MKRRNIFKKSQKLPSNYSDVLMQHEIDLEKGILNVDLIRKLLYLYSIAIEYYDSINKTEHHKFYINKLNNLLSKEKVISFLDQIKQDSSSNKQTHFELFKEENNEMKRSNSNEKNIEIKVLDTLEDNEHSKRLMTRNYSIKQIKRDTTFFFENNVEKYKEEVQKLDKKMDNIEDNLKIDMANQAKNFEQIKLRKLERISSKKIIENKKRNSRRESKFLQMENINLDEEMKEKIIQEIKEKNDSLMAREIEEYIEESMQKMYKDMEDLKENYEKQIQELIENNYEALVDGFREDLENELSTLKNSYEEQRTKEVERIRLKYLNI